MLLPSHLTHPHTSLAHAHKEESREQRPASEDTVHHLASLLVGIVQEIRGFRDKSGTLDWSSTISIFVKMRMAVPSSLAVIKVSVVLWGNSLATPLVPATLP